MNVDEWALENAAQLVAHVERHGIGMTWAEARDHLLQCGRGLELPVYVDGGEGGLVLLGSAVPAWQRPDFVEEVAAGLVLGEGKQFFPLDPAVAETPIAVPWALASELVYRLSLLLSEQLMVTPGTPEDIAELVELSFLLARLSGEVSTEMACVPADGDGVCVIDDEPYLLMAACDVWKAAGLLREVDGRSATVHAVADPGVLGSGVTVREAADTFLWDLELWLTNPAGQ
jgi:hypothetical protein